MHDAYVIEIGGRTAGIVARNGPGLSFSFFAAAHAYNPMDGRRFANPAAAERAARHLARYGALPADAEKGPSCARAADAGEKR
jgi:hypothetical protein